MRNTYHYAQLLRDEELRVHLERGDTVCFTEAVRDSKEIERQVERLGFGDSYAAYHGTRTERGGWHTHTKLSPLRVHLKAAPHRQQDRTAKRPSGFG